VPVSPPWDLRLEIDGTSFANRAAENDEFNANSIPDPGTSLGLATRSGAKVAFGTAVAGFTAAALSAIVVVNHGLGTTPVVVMVDAQTVGAPALVFAQTFTYTGTQFSLQAWSQGGAWTGNATIGWVAIG
jgi:hypothetical protein